MEQKLFLKVRIQHSCKRELTIFKRPMMKNATTLLFTLALLCITTGIAHAQLSVDSIEIGTSVEDRELIGAGTMFSSDVNTLYCLTKISGAEDSPVIQHVWYHNDEEKARVDLTIRTPSFRTWSSKKIWHTWTGEWRVDVVDSSGTVLASETFTISE